MFEQIEEIFRLVMKYGILVLEIVGAVLILYYSVRALVFLVKDMKKSRHEMATGITLGLNFLLGSEVLKTIIAPDWTEVGLTCAVLLMRAGITVLLHWENKHEG